MEMDRDYSTRGKVKITFLILMISLLTGCSEEKPRYGVTFNTKRREIGLPILHENWELSKVSKTGSVWVNHQEERDKPFYWEKTVVYNNDTVLWESNQYKGPKYYETIDGKFKEELYIIYNFFNNGDNEAGWECTLFNQETASKTLSGKITKAKADSILLSWGITEVK